MFREPQEQLRRHAISASVATRRGVSDSLYATTLSRTDSVLESMRQTGSTKKMMTVPTLDIQTSPVAAFKNENSAASIVSEGNADVVVGFERLRCADGSYSPTGADRVLNVQTKKLDYRLCSASMSRNTK